jgi:hypothetical protein
VDCRRADHRHVGFKLAIEAMAASNGGGLKRQPLWAMAGLQGWLWTSGRLTWQLNPGSPSHDEAASWWDLLAYRLAGDVLGGGAAVPGLPRVLGGAATALQGDEEEGLGLQAWQRAWGLDSIEARVALIRDGRLNDYSRGQVPPPRCLHGPFALALAH